MLQALGMNIAFTPQADFTGINNLGGLFISDVKHKTFVEVNEEGTEAAAVTVVIMIRTSMVESLIRVDRPFIFCKMEKTSGTVLFIGKISEPKAGAGS
jgi:serpin B